MINNKPQQVQTGTQQVRIYRAPLDKEQVMNTYSDLQDHIEPKGNCETKTGSFYAGMITSVVDDNEVEKNGPYYISYTKTGTIGAERISYTCDKIITESDLQKKIMQWGRIL